MQYNDFNSRQNVIFIKLCIVGRSYCKQKQFMKIYRTHTRERARFNVASKCTAFSVPAYLSAFNCILSAIEIVILYLISLCAN